MVKGKAFRKSWKEARKPLRRRASSRVKSVPKASYEVRQEQKRDLDETKAKQAELLEARKAVRKLKAKKQAEKKKRKQENEIRSGQYQVIKKTDKIRKWHKNARRQLLTMAPEQIERLIKGGRS
mmetsp:Transcript_71492/g.155290  ORF Transcript_71492/g.155290 Transcript_71492/m.155290 type:complete len:124 (-) Transcript_71492:168-539(-)